MKFSQEAIPYLDGKEFSNGYKFKYLGKIQKPQSRIKYLEDLVKGKKVIHVGFADHIPLIEDKIKKGLWLHKRLLDSARFCAGIDIDSDAVMFIRDKFKIPNLYNFNIIQDAIPEELKQPFDYMILGEVLEHIDNPVLFLNSLKEKYFGYISKVIITVPNALALNNLEYAFRETEFVNSDHRFWFTPFTLAKVGTRAGLIFDSFEMCQTWGLNSWWKNHLIRKNPMFRENLVMSFTLS